MKTNEIFLGTILLEPNRWPDKAESTYSRLQKLSPFNQGPPQILASQWMERAVADGFDGVELWENHALLCSDEEFERITASPVPVSVYSAYFGLEDDGRSRRDVACDAIQQMSAKGVKYNFGPDLEKRGEYIRNLRELAARLDPSIRIICECHGGSIAATPESAASLMAELGEERFQSTVHLVDEYEGYPLETWVATLGETLGHVHVAHTLEHGQSLVQKRINILQNHGFSGSFTIEFTTGIQWGQTSPPVETLYQNALNEKKMLQDTWNK